MGLGIITTRKAYLDTVDALQRLRANAPTHILDAIRHYKIGLSWPVDSAGFRQFAQGLDHIIVIEEKNSLIEQQIKDLLFNDRRRPTICGKRDLNNDVLIRESGQLQPDLVHLALRRWITQTTGTILTDAIKPEVIELRRNADADSQPEDELKTTNGQTTSKSDVLTRRPYFCSGCPHSTSTRIPEGSQALGGVGCHYMASWMDRNTSGLTQMGGEGTDWIGLSPYTRMPHIFQNMGEGNYFHSGYLAIRQAIAANTTITYKILFNDAVAILCYPVAGSAPEVLATLKSGKTHTAVNTWLTPTAEFTRNPDVSVNPEPLLRTIQTAAGISNTWVLNAHSMAVHHFGDSILANMLMLGFVWQHGGIPVSEVAILHALKLNGVAVTANQEAFQLGRVALSMYKLMAYKDEYEIARLFSNGEFRKQLADQFEGDYSLKFHLAPPLIARKDPITGVPRKMDFGPWLDKGFSVLARVKLLRGTWMTCHKRSGALVT